MNSNINNVFGKKVAEMRKRLNISQEELGDRCGLHRTYIGAIERGEKSPTLDTVEKIAKGLSVPVCELFSEIK